MLHLKNKVGHDIGSSLNNSNNGLTHYLKGKWHWEMLTTNKEQKGQKDPRLAKSLEALVGSHWSHVIVGAAGYLKDIDKNVSSFLWWFYLN